MSTVSIVDLAKAAGVAPSTVSRALQDHPRISPARCAEIQALAQQMGYRPSLVARSLVTGQTHALGFVVTDVTDPFVAEVLKGAEAACRAEGYSLLFAMSNRDPDQEIEAAHLLLDRQVDGLIVISSRVGERYAALLQERSLPLVLVNNELKHRQAHSVRMDNHGGARLAVGYLWELGHRRIAFVAGPQGGRSSSERLAGYRAGCEAYGLAVAPEWIVAGGGLLEDGARALDTLMHLPQPPTAVLCYNDMAAIGLLAAAQAAGVRVPADLSIIGYDNIPFSAFTTPALTTVDQPKQTLGRLAVQTCLTALAGGAAGNTVVEGQLIIRASTGPAL